MSSWSTETSSCEPWRGAALAVCALGFALLAAAAPALAVDPKEAKGKAEAPPEYVERTFTLQFRKTDEAALLIRPFLSQEGALTIRAKSLTVRDTPPIVERCGLLIAQLDFPPRTVAISVTLLKAGTARTPPGPSGAPTVSDQIRGVGESLRKLFNYTSYTPLDALVIQGTEGDAVAYTFATDYRIGFLLEPTPDQGIVRLKDLVLERIRREKDGHETRREILHTSVNTPIGKTNVLGIGREEPSSGALFLVFSASARPAPGIAMGGR